MTRLNATYGSQSSLLWPELIHLLQPHSEVPKEDKDWPAQPSILEFQSRVRERLLGIYNRIGSGEIKLTRKVARVLFMTLEHEAFHAEVCRSLFHERVSLNLCRRLFYICCCNAPERGLFHPLGLFVHNGRF